MASWLGGLGSGLGQSLGQVGGSLSSLTGQISSFTKDMLLEGKEEAEGVAADVEISGARIRELEGVQRSENERLRRFVTELEEKHEAAELQVKQQSLDFRNRLQQKEVEISHLKAKLNALQDEMQKKQASAQLSSASLAGAAQSPFMTSIQPPASAFQGEDLDLGDVIWSQQEINTLSGEVSRLQAELSHWKQLAQASKVQGLQNSDPNEIYMLRNTIKELKERLDRERDERQHELSALQDTHRQKLAEHTRRHRDELGDYEDRIEELEEQLARGGSDGAGEKSKIYEMQKTIHALETEKAEAARKMQELERRVSDLSRELASSSEEKALLRKENELAMEEKVQLGRDYEALLSEFREQQGSQPGGPAEVAALQGEVIRLREALLDAQKEGTGLKAAERSNTAVEELEGTVQALLDEKCQLEKDKEELQAEVSRIRSAEDSDVASRLAREELEAKELRLAEVAAEKEALAAELEELDKQNQEALEHLFLIKEQLNKQRIEADGSIAQLKEDLQKLKEDVSRLESENAELRKQKDNQNEELRQTTSALNELRGENQRLSSQTKDFSERINQLETSSSTLREENLELQRIIQRGKEELSADKQDSPSQFQVHDGQSEAVKNKVQLSEIKQSNEDLEKEICDLKMENEMLLSTQEQTKVQLQEAMSANAKDALEKQTLIEALRMQKSQLELELNHTENRLLEQAQKYERTIDEFTSARKMDTSALQQEHERLVKLNQSKDFELAESKRILEQLEKDHEETKQMLSSSLEGQKQLTDLINEKEKFVLDLKEKNGELQQSLKHLSETSKECDKLRQSVEDKERTLASMKEDNSHLKEEIERLKDQQGRPQPAVEPKTLDIITDLEVEITQLNKVKDSYEEELKLLKTAAEKQSQQSIQLERSLREKIRETDEAKTRHKQIVETYEKLLAEKDSEIGSLRQTNELISSQLQNEQLLQNDSTVILPDTKGQTINGENGNEKHDLSKAEIERLVKGIKEKDMEIKALNEKNVGLTKQIDQLAKGDVGKLTQIIQQKDLEIQSLSARVSSVNYSQDVVYLQQQIQAYGVEREQVLAILNEKTRENSQLRTEYHKLMDVVAAKESALLKLQDENQRLSRGQEGSTNEMFKETIQNLSRIIREKDIEIDALTQKSQTLLAVLQASNSDNGNGLGAISSNQFEELLQERDKLKQQVKKMEEWKQQVMTTVKNMQHESAHFEEHLDKLRKQMVEDCDSNSKLQVEYDRLVQNYEQKETMLKGLNIELRDVQRSLEQLSLAKALILGELDAASLQPGTSGLPAGQGVPSAAPPDPSGEQATKALQERERLKIQLQEKEATIRTLQENNQRLSDSVAVTSERVRKDQRDADAEIKQLKEKNDVLQKSLKEKDLLIKTKGDKLNSATENLRNKENENELLKQAVTNLKERTHVLETDIRKLEAENEKVVAKGAEKATEFQALHETNMQFSMMLREMEFESNSMREKASALESLLKEREQGKTGELNQLLNEVKSMQEKAVLFQHERDQVMLTLKQKQMENGSLQSEVQHLREKEQRLSQELERLRHHLLEMEDSYTREALAAEGRETDLRKKVSLLENKLSTSSSAVQNASLQATMQVESLQEQLNLVSKQRDEIAHQLRMSQEQVRQYAVSLSNLQMVLEQFQQEEKAMYSAELNKHKKQNKELKAQAEKLENMVASLQEQLDEANSALEAAARLTEQLDLKEEQMLELQRQSDLKQEMLEEAQNKLLNLISSTEGKVDKLLMRNLFIGHFQTPKKKRHEVLRLMGSILGINKQEMEELLTDDSRGVTGWVTGWFGGSPGTKSVPSTPQRPTSSSMFNTSFSELFVKFLETESLPTLPPLKMSLQDITPLEAGNPRTATAGGASGAAKSSRKADSNPFLAPRSDAVPLVPVSSLGASASAHLLLKPISDALPTFTPLPVSSDGSAGSVLRDLLKQ
ncbi:thyroid receptor-interacting protein 11 [Spea bombifrons]|uniref:thyroid receptor-interacting protein 11 n=1 Tax=Spea bombifrons TaxID=233779 RepID=UPI002349C057|nr:thyroid receptor-interacting protein 11 [Spea bombifrons]